MDLLDRRNHLCNLHCRRLLCHPTATASTRTKYAQYRRLGGRNSHHNWTRHAGLCAIRGQCCGLEHAMGTLPDRSLVTCNRRVRVLAALPGDQDTKASSDEDVDVQEQ
jgi:hypothetical protein